METMVYKGNTGNTILCNKCESTRYCVCNMLIELGHCEICLYDDCLCSTLIMCKRCNKHLTICTCYDDLAINSDSNSDLDSYEKYGKFHNCSGEDCKECIRIILVANGYCATCYETTCICALKYNLSPCSKCESPTECICELLILHGNCAVCLNYGEGCICTKKIERKDSC